LKILVIKGTSIRTLLKAYHMPLTSSNSPPKREREWHHPHRMTPNFPDENGTLLERVGCLCRKSFVGGLVDEIFENLEVKLES
jgi:hypothetical protein